jgi:predicted molibdopterin-dependent oxidoreductase YjgC
VRIDVSLADGVDEQDDVERWVQSACLLCSNGCGLDIAVAGGRIAGVRGRGEDRVNHGRLGPKGLFGWQANNAEDRLTTPLVRRGGRLEEAGRRGNAKSTTAAAGRSRIRLHSNVVGGACGAGAPRARSAVSAARVLEVN